MTGNWAGEPVPNCEKMLLLIRATATGQGLTVYATLDRKIFLTQVVSDAKMVGLNS
ncbi:MAG: hypothetical protein M1570_05905 [Chloroflexi bacterium]|nr:hypothetical protein [Chloroflexota bacterium]